MTKILFFIVVLIGAGALIFFTRQKPETLSQETTSPQAKPSGVSVIATNLEIPWDIAFLPEGGMLVTERTGKLLLLKDGTRQDVLFEQGKQRGEGGLLGVTLHPDFAKNRFVYLYMTAPGKNNETQNRVVRYRYAENKFTQDKVIISGIPGAIYHDGGRMEFGPDGMLYITTGDATTPELAQNLNSTAGKILRLKDDGSLPGDNPFGTAVYSYGHRNPQGLAWDSAGRLWSTEHGRSGALSGLDEINLIQRGANYGWPDIEGDKTKANMIVPKLHSGPSTTWAPASAVYLNGSLFFGGLLGESLYEARLDGERVVELKTHFKKEFGRIRTVRIGPDGMLYLTTSNRDGRGNPSSEDDKIIRVNPAEL